MPDLAEVPQAPDIGARVGVIYVGDTTRDGLYYVGFAIGDSAGGLDAEISMRPLPALRISWKALRLSLKGIFFRR